jgi:phosphonate transport system permease protein
MNTYPAKQFCIKCFTTILVIITCIVGSFLYLQMPLFEIFSAESLANLSTYVGRFFPADISSIFLKKIGIGIIETLAISAIGTLVASFFAILLALPAAGLFGSLAQQLVGFLLNFLRSVPELVWATLMVLTVGLGPFAGVLALALHTAGVLGRLFAQSIENSPTQIARSLELSGASSMNIFLYGLLPQISSQILSYSLYRWEMNIRMATILGFVGAGGLGQILFYELSLLHEAQACSVIIAMLLLVIGVDAISAKLRRVQSFSLA